VDGAGILIGRKDGDSSDDDDDDVKGRDRSQSVWDVLEEVGRKAKKSIDELFGSEDEKEEEDEEVEAVHQALSRGDEIGRFLESRNDDDQSEEDEDDRMNPLLALDRFNSSSVDGVDENPEFEHFIRDSRQSPSTSEGSFTRWQSDVSAADSTHLASTVSPIARHNRSRAISVVDEEDIPKRGSQSRSSSKSLDMRSPKTSAGRKKKASTKPVMSWIVSSIDEEEPLNDVKIRGLTGGRRRGSLV